MSPAPNPTPPPSRDAALKDGLQLTDLGTSECSTPDRTGTHNRASEEEPSVLSVDSPASNHSEPLASSPGKSRKYLNAEESSAEGSASLGGGGPSKVHPM
eukprot:5063317-Pyramimonas_sp.AAC.1